MTATSSGRRQFACPDLPRVRGEASGEANGEPVVTRPLSRVVPTFLVTVTHLAAFSRPRQADASLLDDPASRLALLSRRHHRRVGPVVAACGLAVFAAAPQWWFPSDGNRELHWAAWQQAIGSSYVIPSAAMLLLSVRWRLFRLRSGHTRYILGASLVPTWRH